MPLLGSQEVAEALKEWSMEVATGLAGGYDHIPPQENQPLPDVVADVAEVEVTDDPRDFPHMDVQQAWFHIFRCELSFMVDNTDPAAAAAQLRGFESELTASLMQDGTLGGRVPFLSPRFSFDFTPPFVERPGGLRGREMTMSLVVGELIGGPS